LTKKKKEKKRKTNFSWLRGQKDTRRRGTVEDTSQRQKQQRERERR
jgi:hypothetical protein